MAIYCTVVHFSRQKNHFYLLLLHVFKIKIKNEYKNNNHKTAGLHPQKNAF